MIAVIFEFEPAPGRVQDYQDFAAELNPQVREIDGFISIERFQNLTQPDKFVSISFWRDEAAIEAWRNRAGHREAQAAGRTGIFNDYRLRVAEVIRDYGFEARSAAPDDSRAAHG